MNAKPNMSQLCLVGIIVFLFTGVLLQSPSPARPVISGNASEPANQATLLSTYGQLPLSFEANQGQTDGQVKFISRGSGYGLFLTAAEAVLSLRRPAAITPQNQPDLAWAMAEAEDTQPTESTVLRMQLVGASLNPQVVGLDELPGKVNYFIGNDPTKWRTSISTYGKVKYEGVYPGIDLVYYGNQGELEYDFVVAPNADPKSISLGFEGADKLEVDSAGDLVLHLAGEQVRMQKPSIYQEINSIRQEISGNYVLVGKDRVGFHLEAYNASQPLVIDPVLVYSTYLGGSGNELGFGIAADATGQAYVTGWTFSLNFPTTAPLQAILNGSSDAFVTKLDPTGSPVYSTYFGGSSEDLGGDIAVDASGNVYVTGRTSSLDFPTLNPLQATHQGGNDGFVTKLNSTGTIAYSTFLGGAYGDQGQSITVDVFSNAYVTGLTNSPNFPVVNPFQAIVNGGVDAFVAELNANGSALVYSTYLGGSGDDDGRSIAVDLAGNAFVTGSTVSTNFPTANPFQPALAGATGSDAFVAKLDSTGITLIYSTYLGGTTGFYGEWGQGIAVDATGNAYITGTTFSDDFPTTMSSFQPTKSPGANSDAFVTKLNPTGASLVYSTFLSGPSGNSDDGAADLAVDSAGNAYIVGATRSANFPTLNAVQPTIGGSKDAFITKLNPTGSVLIYSTFLGGSAEDNESGALGEGAYGPHIAVDPAGNAYATGNTSSTDFPTANPLQPSFGGGLFDAFVVKIGDNAPPLDMYLHGTGPNANPPTLFLDNTAPTAATTKYKDSSSVKFSGGNIWKDVGIWTATPAFSVGTLTTLSELHVWLGLKNSDDQGTNFDLRTEVYKNGALVASDETYCITGITRNPALAQEAIVPFGYFSPVAFNGTTDMLSLKVLTRIGTNGAGGFCGGHSNATGLRMYFDATSRPSKFDATFGP